MSKVANPKVAKFLRQVVDQLEGDAIAGKLFQEVANCWWTQNVHGWWESSCRKAFAFTTDGPVNNGFKFCPYCGRNIRVK